MAQSTVREPAGRPAAGDATGDRRPRRRGRRVFWLSALVAACSLAVYWVIMPPPLYYDPYYVFEGARRWPDIPLDQWPFSEVPHQVTRMGLVLPTRLAQELLGTGQAGYVAVAALGGCVFFVGCYLAVRSLFGDVIGVVSALALLAHPFFTLVNPFTREVTWSTGALLPDMPGAGLFALAMAALVVAARRAGRAQTRLLLAAGVCFGSAFLAREFLAFMFLAIPVYFALLRIPLRRLAVIAGPMAAILAVNLAHNAAVFGDPLAGLVSAAEHGGAPSEPVTRRFALESFVRAMWDWHPLGVVFIVLLALNLVGWAATRDRRLALTLVWFLSLWAPLTLLSGLLDPHDITLRGWLSRYWFAAFPALAAGGLGALVLLARKLPARTLPARLRPAARHRTSAIAAVAAVAAVAYLVPAVRAVPDLPRDRAWSELRGWLAGRDGAVREIWTDRRLGQTLNFYTRSIWGDPRWRGEIYTFPQDVPALPPAGRGPLLFTRWRGLEPQIAYGFQPNRTPGWRPLWRSSDGVLELWQH